MAAAGLGAIALVAALALLDPPTGASTTANLASEVVHSTLPGQVAAAPGPDNGPLTQSDLALALSGNAGAAKLLAPFLADGDIHGYLRVWTHRPSAGDATMISAFTFAESSEEQSFFGGLSAGEQRGSGAARFAVPGIPGATGVVVHSTLVGASVIDHVVTFTRGNVVFLVRTVSESDDVTTAAAVSVAARQLAQAVRSQAPAGLSPRTKKGIDLGYAMLALVAVAVMVLLAQRRRNRTLEEEDDVPVRAYQKVQLRPQQPVWMPSGDPPGH